MGSKISLEFCALNTVQENKTPIASWSNNHVRQNYVSGKNEKHVYLRPLSIHVMEKLFSNMRLMTLKKKKAHFHM